MEFGLLGPLAVWKDGREVPIGAAKQRAALAVLLLRANEPVPKETLIDLPGRVDGGRRRSRVGGAHARGSRVDRGADRRPVPSA
jgi:hypothetical protein